MVLRVLFIGFVFIKTAFGGELIARLDLQHAITDMIYRDGLLFVSTERSEVFEINLKKLSFRKVLELPKIRDFTGEAVPPKVFSIDVSEDGRMLIASEGERGFSRLYVYEDGGLKEIVPPTGNLMIKKARFMDERRAVLGLLGDEILILDLESGGKMKRIQVGQSSLSDIEVDEDRKRVAVSDEGGVVYMVDLERGRVRRVGSVNKDKTYDLDFKNGRVMVGGRDRRAVVYFAREKRPVTFRADFFVFAVALNEKGRVGAYMLNEKNDVAVVSVEERAKVDVIRGHKYPVSVMVFAGDRLITGCDDGKLYIWRYKR